MSTYVEYSTASYHMIIIYLLPIFCAQYIEMDIYVYSSAALIASCIIGMHVVCKDVEARLAVICWYKH